MRILVAIAALLTAAPTIPQEPQPRWSDGIPPARFQATGFVPVLFVPPAMIAELCGPVPENMIALACTRPFTIKHKTVRVVVMPDPCPFAERDQFAHVQCHENSHYLSNWKHEAQ
jgi:hypothetical protein